MATVAYKDMVRKKKMLAEYDPFPLGGKGYFLKLRIMEFEVAHEDGSIHFRGPCLSLQLFNPNGHFLKAISMNVTDLPDFIDRLQQIEAMEGG